jgi:hypothetical protein
MKRHSIPQLIALRTPEICNFDQFRSSPSRSKGRPKLTGYAYRSLDDQRRSQEFTHGD